MKPETVQLLSEQDYCQLGELKQINVRPVQTEFSNSDDVIVDVVRTIPRYCPPIEGNMGRTLEDCFHWRVSGKWSKLLNYEEVTITHGFKRQASAYDQQCCLEDCSYGRKFVVRCDPEWDFVAMLYLLKPKPIAGCLYRFTYENQWEILRWSIECTKRIGFGNIWTADSGKDISEEVIHKGSWKPLTL